MAAARSWRRRSRRPAPRTEGKLDASATNHDRLADDLRRQVAGPGGAADPALRQAILARVAGGPVLPPPYDSLVVGIRDAANRVTDDEVAAVRAAAGSDKAAFEVIMSAAIAAGLLRWDKAAEAIEEAVDAPR